MKIFDIFKKKKTPKEDNIIIKVKACSPKYQNEMDIVVKKLIKLLKIFASNKEYERILKNVCTQDLLSRGTNIDREKYKFINEECTIYFQMNEDEKAIVELYHNEGALEKREKYIFRKKFNEWKLDEIYTGYSNKEDWKMFHL